MAAAGWDLNDGCSLIRITILKEESASIAGFCRKEELMRPR
jgi:hypothetical protein